MSTVRLGAVPYLNARPLLLFGCGERPEVLFGSPRELGKWLEEGRIEAGTIPAFYHLSHPDRPVVEGIGIASRNKVESVRLFLRQPVNNPPHLPEVREVRRVAVDEGSMTAASLLKIILRHRYQVQPEFVPHPPDLNRMLETADAALLIGDKAMRAGKENSYPSLDLGEEWWRLTGLPFVWALWVCRDEGAARRVGPLVRRAKEAGLRNLERVAKEAAAATGLEEADCLRYVSQTIHYDLGVEEEAALKEFRRLWEELQ